MSRLNQVILLFLITQEKVLLGLNKDGFMEGNYTGIGGGQEANETIEQTVVRECQEEIGVTPLEITHAATIHNVYPHKPSWNSVTQVYTSTSWHGEITESDEIIPKWFNKNNLPFDQMWSYADHWLPNVLAGQNLNATFSFKQNLEFESYQIHKGGEH
jgi:8-oxo-dGTP diphosphatase